MLVSVASRMTMLEHLPKNSVGAEIGVLKGDLSDFILKIAKPRVFHLIDPWLSYSGLRLSQDEMEQIYESVALRFKKEISAGTILLHRQKSEEGLGMLADGSLDWAYIDGDHSYEAVLADLQLALQKVRRDGLICGDDYGWVGGQNDTVARALHVFLGSNSSQVLIEFVLDRQFVLKKL